MTKAQAEARWHKLRALADPARGGTPAERDTAMRKAAGLLLKFPGIRTRAPKPRGPRPRVWTAPARGGPANWQWGFNPVTGAASQNVTVHHHADRSNWKIEIDLTGQPSAIGKGVDEGERELER